MIGKILTAIAGRSIARSVGGASAGPAGAIIGATLPLVLPQIARRFGPAGMVGLAVGGVAFTRWLERRAQRRMDEIMPRAPDVAAPTSPGPATTAAPQPPAAPAVPITE
jgi:hypothetical protein